MKSVRFFFIACGCVIYRLLDMISCLSIKIIYRNNFTAAYSNKSEHLNIILFWVENIKQNENRNY